MTREMFSGGAQLVTAIGDAYVKIAGGGAQADTVANLTARAYNFFKSKGGKVDSAKVTVDKDAKTFKISDGSFCLKMMLNSPSPPRARLTFQYTGPIHDYHQNAVWAAFNDSNHPNRIDHVCARQILNFGQR